MYINTHTQILKYALIDCHIGTYTTMHTKHSQIYLLVHRVEGLLQWWWAGLDLFGRRTIFISLGWRQSGFSSWRRGQRRGGKGVLPSTLHQNMRFNIFHTDHRDTMYIPAEWQGCLNKWCHQILTTGWQCQCNFSRGWSSSMQTTHCSKEEASSLPLIIFEVIKKCGRASSTFVFFSMVRGENCLHGMFSQKYNPNRVKLALMRHSVDRLSHVPKDFCSLREACQAAPSYKAKPLSKW